MSVRSFLSGVYYESGVTLLFSVALTSVWGVSEVIQREFFPSATKEQLIGGVLVGWLTFFGVFFGSAVVNPAVGLMLMFQEKLSIGKFCLYAVLQFVLTLLGILIVAATYEVYPDVFKGIQPPGPPPAHGSRLHVFASEFAVTLSVLYVGGLCGRFGGRVFGTFLGSVFYYAVAYAEAGAYSGAIMNPASILALHVYKDFDKLDAWMVSLPKVVPYVAGSAAAAALLGLKGRHLGAGAGGKKQAVGGKPAMSTAAAERRRRATKAE